MKLIPAMSIRGGHVAVAEAGRYSYLRNDDGQFRTPANVLKDLNLPGEEMFILDIDGLERNSPNLATVKRMSSLRDIWLDAGTRDSGSMMDLFVSDVSKVVLGTLSLTSLDELFAACEISEDILFSAAWDRGIVSRDPRISGMGMEALVAELGGKALPGQAVFFDLGGLRDRTPPDLDTVMKLASRFDEVYICGRVAGDDMEKYEAAGVGGLIVDYRELGEPRDVRT